MQSSKLAQKHRVLVEFCTSCHLHNWCTHHNEQRYLQAFKELQQALASQFPDLQVAGNEPPAHFAAIKAKENKYFDSRQKKYVLFPAIGSFQVFLDDQLVFSKKNSNSWPNTGDILSEVHFRLTGERRRLSTEHDTQQQSNTFSSERSQKETIVMANKIIENHDHNLTFYNQKSKKQFTLTDHFKRYKMNKKVDENLGHLYAESEAAPEPRISRITPEDIQKLHSIWGKKESLPTFIRDKAFIQEIEGKKEMLVNLSSIEEQNDLKQNQFLSPVPKKKDISNLEMQFDKLERKFMKFQTRVSEVNNKNFGMDIEMPQPRQSIQYQLKSKQSLSSPKFSLADKIQEVNSTYNAQRLIKQLREAKGQKKFKIQQYIRSTSEEKNEKLEEIYGPQLIKQVLPNEPGKNQNTFQASRISNRAPLEVSKISKQKSFPNIVSVKKEVASVHSFTDNNEFNMTQNTFKSNILKRNANSRQKLGSAPKDLEMQKVTKMFKKEKRAYQSRSVLQKLSTPTNSSKNQTAEGQFQRFNFMKDNKQKGDSSNELKVNLKQTDQKGLKKYKKNKNPQKQSTRQSRRAQQVKKNEQVQKIYSSPRQLSFLVRPTLRASKSNSLMKTSFFNKNFVSGAKLRSNQDLDLTSQSAYSSDPSSNIPQSNESQTERDYRVVVNNSSHQSNRPDFTKEEHEAPRSRPPTHRSVTRSNNSEHCKKSTAREIKTSQKHSAKSKSNLSYISSTAGHQKNNHSQRRQVHRKVEVAKSTERQHSTSNHKEANNSRLTVRSKQESSPGKNQTSRSSAKNSPRLNGSKITPSQVKRSPKGSEKMSKSFERSPNKSNILSKSQASQRSKISTQKHGRTAKKIEEQTQEPRLQQSQLKKSQVSKAASALQRKSPIHDDISGKSTKSQKKLLVEGDSSLKSVEVENVKQQDNVVAQAKPRKIFSIDEQRPDMVDVAIQKNAPKVEAHVQTLDPVQREQEEQNMNENELEVQVSEGEVESIGEQPARASKSKSQYPEHKMEASKIKSYSQKLGGRQVEVQQSLGHSKITQKKEEVAQGRDTKIPEKLRQSKQHSEISRSQNPVQINSHKGSLKKEQVDTAHQNSPRPQPRDKAKPTHKSKPRKYQPASIIKQLYGAHYHQSIKQAQRQPSCLPEAPSAAKSLPMLQLYPNSCIFSPDSIQHQQMVDNSGSLGTLCRLISILSARNEYLLIRLFEDPHNLQVEHFGVWLCDAYAWKCYCVPSTVEVDENSQPSYLCHQDHQLWPIILGKALATLYGGYEKLAEASLTQLFHALTGSNFISFRVKEDPEKNNRLLKFIASNEKKNFITVAEKRLHNSLGQSTEAQHDSQIFFVLSQKIVNNKQVLLRMKKPNSQAFWVKLQKFASQFAQVSILQLRVNHNFCQLSLDSCGSGVYKVVELVFEEQSFGCVSVTCEAKESDFRLHLYKEEQDNVLRLVGEVKEKRKKSTFFDCCFEEGRYFLFADLKCHRNRIAYMGEGRPHLIVKEEILEAGLKNDYTEYIPIDELPRRQEQEMPKFLNMTRKAEKDGNLGFESALASEQLGLSRQQLRSQFIEYLVGN